MNNRDLESLIEIGLSEPEEVIAITDEPKLPSYVCFPNKFAKQKFYVDGVLERAKIRALGEFNERLCLVNPDKNLLFDSKYNPSKDKFIDPSIFNCFSDEQL